MRFSVFAIFAAFCILFALTVASVEAAPVQAGALERRGMREWYGKAKAGWSKLKAKFGGRNRGAPPAAGPAEGGYAEGGADGGYAQ
ncbi:hypothetical protein DFJ73DRAFT_927177 [Zopfochytrium polystomum]|nr:hypothetical protein DFJ73DRAFT_927177 [Zopfochytrium polystomum]